MFAIERKPRITGQDILRNANLHTDNADMANAPVHLPPKGAPMLPPRLLGVHAAANYLAVSTWTIRSWVADRHIVPVELPPLRPREGDRRKVRLRRLLFDRAALDQFVDRLQGAGR